MFVLLAAASLQTTWYVDASGTAPGTGTQNDPYTRVDYALAQPSTQSGDTVLVRPGTYTGALDFLGKDVVLRSSDGPAVTTLQGLVGSGPTVKFDDGESDAAVLEGFTIVGGDGVPLPPFGSAGGGVYVDGASPRLRDLVIENGPSNVWIGAGAFISRGQVELTNVEFRSVGDRSSTAEGGGLYAEASRITLADCTLTGCAAQEGGGLFAEQCHVSLASSLFTQCDALFQGAGATFDQCVVDAHDTEYVNNRPSEASGAGMRVRGGSVVCTNCEFRSNRSAREGGGIQATNSANVSVRDSQFIGNSAYGDGPYSGGAIYSLNSTLELLRCEFRGNRGQFGGAVDASGGLTIDECEFRSNSADGDFMYSCNGGAVNVSGAATIRRSLFVGNSAEDVDSNGGGAIYGPASVEHCTFWNNRSEPGTPGTFRGFGGASMTNSIVWNVPGGFPLDGVDATYSIVQGGALGVGNLDLDPLFRDPDDDLRLLPGSPAIDSGDPGSALDPDGTVADMGALPFDPFAGEGIGTETCVANPNSTGAPATLAAFGSTDVATNLVTLAASNVPANSIGFFLTSQVSGSSMLGGGSQGTLCLGGSILRFSDTPLDERGTGIAAFRADLVDFPQMNVVAPGESWIFQYWFRDANPQVTSNTSAAVRITFQ